MQIQNYGYTQGNYTQYEGQRVFCYAKEQGEGRGSSNSFFEPEDQTMDSTNDEGGEIEKKDPVLSQVNTIQRSLRQRFYGILIVGKHGFWDYLSCERKVGCMTYHSR